MSVEGVLEAEVSLEAGTAQVRARAGTSPEAIIAAISAAGNYRAKLKED